MWHPATARACDKSSALVDGQWRGPARRLRDQFTALDIAQGLRCIADETARSHRLYVRRARCAYTRALRAPSRHWHHVTTSHPRQCDASAATAVAKRAWHIPPTPRQLLLSPQPRAHRHASCTRAVATATAPSPHAVAHWTCAIASAMCKTMGARAWSCVHARALVCDATGAGRGLRGLARAIEGAQWNVPTPPKRPHLARGECCGALIKRY